MKRSAGRNVKTHEGLPQKKLPLHVCLQSLCVAKNMQYTNKNFGLFSILTTVGALPKKPRHNATWHGTIGGEKTYFEPRLTAGMGSSWEKPWSIAQDVGKRSSSSGMTDVMV